MHLDAPYYVIFSSRYGRDHKIDVDILRYDNPSVKAEVMAELVTLKKFDADEPQLSEMPTTSQKVSQPAKKRKKTNEIQGALALMELAGN